MIYNILTGHSLSLPPTLPYPAPAEWLCFENINVGYLQKYKKLIQNIDHYTANSSNFASPRGYRSPLPLYALPETEASNEVGIVSKCTLLIL